MSTASLPHLMHALYGLPSSVVLVAHLWKASQHFHDFRMTADYSDPGRKTDACDAMWLAQQWETPTAGVSAAVACSMDSLAYGVIARPEVVSTRTSAVAPLTTKEYPVVAAAHLDDHRLDT